MLNINELIYSFIDLILFDNYYQTSFSLEIKEEMFLDNKYIYSETEILLLINLVNAFAFAMGYNHNISSLYLIERIANNLIFHRNSTNIYSNNLGLGRIDINYLIKEFSKKGSFENTDSIKLKSTYSEYKLLENIIFVGILYETYMKIKKIKEKLLRENMDLKDLILIQKVEKLLILFKKIFSIPLINEILMEYITDYRKRGILDQNKLNSMILSNKLKGIFKEFFKRYLLFIEKEMFFDLKKIDEFKLYEYFIIKSLHEYFVCKGGINSKKPIYKRNEILEGVINNTNFKVYYQSSNLINKNELKKFDLDLENLKGINEKKLYGIPDIIVKFDDKYVFIDAKYKLEFNSREDIYQMIAYTQIFNLDEYNFILVYPCKEKICGGNEITQLLEFSTNNKQVKIITTCLDDIKDSCKLYSKLFEYLLL